MVRRPLPVVSAALVAAAIVTGCSSGDSSPSSARRSGTTATTRGTSPTPATAGLVTSDGTVRTADGRTRTYRLVVPRSVSPDRPAPLLVALHGGIDSGAQFERTSGFDDLAARHAFMVVYPDGIEIGGTSPLARGHVWNGGRCCGAAARLGVDDVGFIREVIDRVAGAHAVDPRRVFAAGHSNGAIMAYRLACELSDRIVAIGLQAGTIEVPTCAPDHPVSVLAIHGTADTNIPITGGRGSGVAGIAFSSPLDAVATFARVDRCARSSTHTQPSNRDVHVETWSPCAHATEVELVRVTGATHAWMGHPSPRAGTALTGAPYQGFDSSAAIWSFLAAHPRER
ncbi:MAG: alpha/beta hydrolase family esterase [Acidimicrobiia bacterium]